MLLLSHILWFIDTSVMSTATFNYSRSQNPAGGFVSANNEVTRRSIPMDRKSSIIGLLDVVVVPLSLNYVESTTLLPHCSDLAQ